MAIAPGANDTPSESAMTPASDSPPTEGHAMEVDEWVLSHLQLALSPRKMTIC